MKKEKWTWLAIISVVGGATLAGYGFDIDKAVLYAPGFTLIMIGFGYLFMP